MIDMRNTEIGMAAMERVRWFRYYVDIKSRWVGSEVCVACDGYYMKKKGVMKCSLCPRKFMGSHVLAPYCYCMGEKNRKRGEGVA